MSTPTPPPYQPAPDQAATAPGVRGLTAPTAYAPSKPKRPPLTGREKRGAAWAGILGFNLLSLGFWIFILPIAIALAGFFIAWIFSLIARSLDRADAGFERFLGFLGDIDFTPWIIPGIIVAVLGLAIMAVAIIVSRAFLKGHGVNRPGAVTWAGAGVAVVAFWLLSWIPGIVVQLLSFMLTAGDADGWTTAWIIGGTSVLLTIATNSIIGWLAWWWMAHAMRHALDSSAVEAKAVRA